MIEKINPKLIKLAIEEAKKADHKQKVGCVIFEKKRIISISHNQSQRSSRKLHPKYQRYPHSIHAETAAILKSKTNLKGSSMLVIRVNKKNEFRMAKPCDACMRYINYVGIKKLYFSISSYPYIIEYLER